MKNALLISALFWSTTALSEAITMHVPEITCAACAQVLKESFAKVNGVTSTLVDIESKTVVVKTEKGIHLSEAQIAKALSEYKYSADSITREESVSDKKD